MVQSHIHIYGQVQGVFYRASMQEKARELGVTGWVRNCADGSVEAMICGPESAISTLISWCQDGPPSARVDDVQVSPVASTPFDGFNILPSQ